MKGPMSAEVTPWGEEGLCVGWCREAHASFWEMIRDLLAETAKEARKKLGCSIYRRVPTSR